MTTGEQGTREGLGWLPEIRSGWQGALGLTALVSLIMTALIAAVGQPLAKAGACPNEVFRTGASAGLPDCRAYELVTPADSKGRRFGDLSSEPELFDLFANELASPVRDSFIFTVQGSALREPGQGNGTLLGDVYQSVRGPQGWQVERHVTPTGEEVFTPYVGGISLDHRYNFVFVPKLFSGTNGSLGENVDYLGDPNGNFELTGVGSLGQEPFAQGRYISPGGQHVIFSTGHETLESGWCANNQQCRTSSTSVKRLEPDAPGGGTGVVYDRSADGPTHVVSLLPEDLTPGIGENASYQGASADGSSIAFKIKGVLYVRINDAETVEAAGGNPTFGGLSADGEYLFYVSGGNIYRFNTATKATEQVNSTEDGEMVNVSTDGSHVYFISPQAITGGEENASGEVAVPPAKGAGGLSAAAGSGTLTAGSTLITSLSTGEGAFAEGMEIRGPGIPEGTTIESVGSGTLTLSAAATTSGTRNLIAGSTLVTSVSTSEGSFLPGMEVSGEGIPTETTVNAVGPGTITLSKPATKSGSFALTGHLPNLYAWNGASPHYIATVDVADAVGVPSLTAWTTHAVAPIDEPGRGPGADPSRSPSNGRVLVFESRAKLTSFDNAGHTEIYRYDDQDKSMWCISCNPSGTPATSNARLGNYDVLRRTTVIHNVSEGGTRVFFETAEALVPADTDGINDIYEWQSPGGGASPTISLISSGHSEVYPQESTITPPHPNTLLGSTPSGKDVFFLAQEELVDGAPGDGASAIYDARVDGGFSTPPPPQPTCPEASPCQGEPGPSPSLAGAASQTVAGAGNITPPKRRHCSGKHRRSKRKKGSCHKKRTGRKR